MEHFSALSRKALLIIGIGCCFHASQAQQTSVQGHVVGNSLHIETDPLSLKNNLDTLFTRTVANRIGNFDTDDLTEGASNLYFTDARAQGAISGGTGVTVTSGSVAIGQAVGTSDNVTFNNLDANGTLDVTGATTLSSTLDVTGATGVDGDFDVNTNKFTVASATGNTAVAGTLAVTGTSSSASGSTVGTLTLADGSITDSSGSLSFGDENVSTMGTLGAGNTSVTGTLSATGATTLSSTLGVTGVASFDGGIKIADGTQGANYILSSDANGNASWKESAAAKSPVYGVFDATAPINAFNSAPYCTGTYIDVPPGPWAVNIGLIMTTGVPHSGGYWVRTVLSTDCAANTAPTYITGGPAMVAGMLSSHSPYGFLSGVIMVDNTGTSTQRLYLWRETCDTAAGADPTLTLQNFARGVYGEDYIYAMPMNN
ncbi:MAG: hypothetical protein ACO3MV_02990 [Flavobacteriales bacterium]